MNTQTAIEVANSIPTNGDVVLEAAKWVFFLLVLLGAGSVPFMMLMKKRARDTNENKVESAMAGASSSLYNHLSSQLEDYRKSAQEASRDRDELLVRITRLEAMSEQFELSKQSVDRLRVKLDLKDQEIRSLISAAAEERAAFLAVLIVKDKEIDARDERITQLENAVRDLEIRLVKDETRQIAASSCPFIIKSLPSSDSALQTTSNTLEG